MSVCHLLYKNKQEIHHVIHLPLRNSFICDSTQGRFASCSKGDAKNPCFKIPDSLCSPHIYMEKMTPNHPSTSMSPLQKQIDIITCRLTSYDVNINKGKEKG